MAGVSVSCACTAAAPRHIRYRHQARGSDLLWAGSVCILFVSRGPRSLRNAHGLTDASWALSNAKFTYA